MRTLYIVVEFAELCSHSDLLLKKFVDLADSVMPATTTGYCVRLVLKVQEGNLKVYRYIYNNIIDGGGGGYT